MDKPFTPTGPAIFVGNTATQIGGLGYAGNCWRVRNMSNSVQYFTYGQTNSVTSVGAPTQGSPSQNTVGMLPQSVEIFSSLLPWMISSLSDAFEVIPGDGL